MPEPLPFIRDAFLHQMRITFKAEDLEQQTLRPKDCLAMQQLHRKRKSKPGKKYIRKNSFKIVGDFRTFFWLGKSEFVIGSGI